MRTRPLTETSLIVHWLTPELGRIATVAKGARRPKSNFRGKLDLFYCAEFSFARSRRSDLHTLREVGLRETHSALRRELGWVEQASYCAALLERATETETPLPGQFTLFAGLLAELPRRAPQPLTVLAFEMKLLRESGLQPNLPETRLSAGARMILERALVLPWEQLATLKPTAVQVSELQSFLHVWLVEHGLTTARARSSSSE